MKYTKYGLKISLEELRQILEYAEKQEAHNSMGPCIYIKGGAKPQIKQFCCYTECNPINHTHNAR